jgi:hypothetical protein
MRTKHGFTRQDEDSLIVIPCLIDVDSFTVALDTGASHTVMDLTPLLMSGYQIKNALRKVPLEAASGVIDSYVFRINRFSCLGITVENMEICAYEFGFLQKTYFLYQFGKRIHFNSITKLCGCRLN